MYDNTSHLRKILIFVKPFVHRLQFIPTFMSQSTCLLIITFIVCNSCVNLRGQSNVRYLTLEKAIEQAENSNPYIRNAHLEVEMAKAGRWSLLEPGPVEVHYRQGQLYTTEYGRYFEIGQSLGSPLAPRAKARELKQEILLAGTTSRLTQTNVHLAIQETWWEWQCLLLEKQLEQRYFEAIDSAVAILANSLAEGRTDTFIYENYRLKALLSQARLFDFDTRQLQTEQRMQQLLFTTDTLVCADTDLALYQITKPILLPDSTPPLLIAEKEQILNLTREQWNSCRSSWTPRLKIGYFVQDIGPGSSLKGWMAGVEIPLQPDKAGEFTRARLQAVIAANNLAQSKMQYTHEAAYLRQSLESQFARLEYLRAELQHLNGKNLTDNPADITLNPLEAAELLPAYNEALAATYRAIVNYNKTAARLEQLLAR